MSDTPDSFALIDPDTLNDAEFAEYKTQMAAADGPLPDETPADKPQKRAAPAAKDTQTAEVDDTDDDDPQGDEAGEGGDRPTTVPHGRLMRERDRRQKAEAAAAEERRRYENLEQRTHELLRLQVQAQQPKEERQPTYEERAAQLQAAGDYVGLQRLQDQTIREIREREQRTEQEQTEYRQRQDFEQRVIGAARQDFEAAVAEDASFGQAYEFMFASAVQQKIEVGGMPAQAAIAEARQQELQFYAETLRAGKSPAKVMRKLAELRGWQPAAAEQQQEDQGADDAVEKMERLNRAKNASRSLSGAGSEARTGLPTMRDIATMSDEDFRAYKEKHGDNAMRLAMGA